MHFERTFRAAGTEYADYDKMVPAPYLRGTFGLNGAPESVRIRITAAGFYDLYINGVRIKAAQNLIEKSNESISDIAEKTGFMTTAHFRRVFKDATGLSPQQYRQYYKRLSK